MQSTRSPAQRQERLASSRPSGTVAFSALESAVIVVDQRGKILWLDRAGEDLIGAASEAARGAPLEGLLPPVLSSGGDAVRRLLEQDREGAATWQVVVQRNAEMGRHLRVRLLSIPALQSSGSRAQKLLLLRDLTQQDAALRKLESSHRLVSLGQLAAGMTHEISNPLTALFSETFMLRDTLSGVGAEAQLATRASLPVLIEHVSAIEQSLRHIAGVLAGMGNFAKPLTPGPLCANLESAVRWAMRASAPEMQDRGRVLLSMADLPLVGLDETRLRQVLLNLLLNAAKALDPTKSASNWVRISAWQRQASVVIVVSDTGSGISAAALSRLFEPFFTGRADGDGTGLGLSVCSSIVESVGGSIEVESELGRGSTFRIELPVVAQELAAEIGG